MYDIVLFEEADDELDIVDVDCFIDPLVLRDITGLFNCLYSLSAYCESVSIGSL